MRRSDYILANSEKPRDAAMRNTGQGLLCFSTTACYHVRSVSASLTWIVLELFTLLIAMTSLRSVADTTRAML